MMGVDDVRPRHSREQARRDRMGGMAAQPAHRAQRAPQQPARFAFRPGLTAEADQLALDVSGQRPRQLERVTFTTAK